MFINHVFKFFLSVRNSNTDDVRVEMEKKLTKQKKKPEETNAGREFLAGINKVRN